MNETKLLALTGGAAVIIILITVLLVQPNMPQTTVNQQQTPDVNPRPDFESKPTLTQPTATNDAETDALQPQTAPDQDQTKAPEPAVEPEPAVPAPQPQTFILDVDDYTGTPSSITVAHGTEVTLIVRVDDANVYYGGIDLRSEVVSTGTIPPGESKTVTFEATESFELIPYWPSSGVRKDYVVEVKVE